jgi:hypothetical protein
MAVGLSKAILLTCKPTSRVKIWEGKHTMTHHFMHEIISK